MLCPKCGVEQPAGSLECSACGVVFAKLKKRREPTRTPPSIPPVAGELTFRSDEGGPSEAHSRWQRLLELLTHVEAEVSMPAFAGRVLVFGLFAVWGIRFLSYPVASPRMMGSFLHLVDLVFHEAGHVILMPLGWSFLTTLGGSLGQIAVPLICTATLLLKARDPFGASIALWWTGQNFLDLAPYIGDARALQLPLLGGATGAEVEGHDWEAILTALGWLAYDRTLATLAHLTGALVILASLAWGGYVLLLQHKHLAHSPSKPVN